MTRDTLPPRRPQEVFDARLTKLWSAYTAAAAQAQASGRIDDGIIAGKAWAAWLEAFLPVPSVALRPTSGRTR